jgi:HD superfamily phosphodiesterase
MGKLSKLRDAVNGMLFDQKDVKLQAEGWVHLYGVSQAAALLASARGLDAGTCAAAGLLHDIHTFRTGGEAGHALHGAAEADEILRGIDEYSGEEREAITHMITRHSDKQAVDGRLEECLKDADVLAHWLYDREKEFDAVRRSRLGNVMAELHISGRIHEE